MPLSGVDVLGVSYIDDTVLAGSPEDVASILQELPTLLANFWPAAPACQDQGLEPYARRCGFSSRS